MAHAPHRRRPARTGSASVFTPDALSVAARHLEVGNEYVASFGVTGYPQEVYPGWLAPLLTYPARLDVSVHLSPIDPATAATRLRTQRAKLESSRRHNARHDRLDDPDLDAAAEDAADLSHRVARGEGRLFRFGLYLTVHAPDPDSLADQVAALRSLCASLLLDAKPATYRALQGWVTTLPVGIDGLGLTRTFDTAAVAAAFPFTSPDLPPTEPTSTTPTGVLYGYNVGSAGLVHWDRFACDNYNTVVLGRSGAGKSYFVKLETLRSLYRTLTPEAADPAAAEGVQAFVVDPEDEYARLAAEIGGTYMHLGAAGVHLNPFDLPVHTSTGGRRTAPADALRRQTLFLHTVLAVAFGAAASAEQRAVLDTAIAETYRQAGITDEARTWTRPAPLLRDLRAVLAARGEEGDHVAADLAARLHPLVDGAYSALLDGPTSTTPDGHLVVFSLRDLPDEVRPLGTLLALDAIWRRVSNPTHRRPRLVVVDEAWQLMQQPEGAQFLFRMAKAARKHWAGLTVATQDTADVLGSELGKAIVANAATQVLLRQAPQAIDEIATTFDLSAGERHFLLSAEKGQGLLSSGTHRVAFHTVASPTENVLITTDPAELAHLAAHDDATDPSLADAYIDLEPG
ncbi:MULTISPECIES: VirB4 family type IV secretion system protein [Prauserella salsuginis group]|uniref:VirB4 family type IV secretion system protein n=1 Tax=Prauserella salsuginis TaxID=387889 RepID=A0ABW6FZY4_9PSEU|nr:MULTISPECIES: ATP-binding protein [Prauserella salsuginis group]MCR3721119.1 AAA-like domain-containing protein [Prauserella flava]MCR3734801.1 AAA-like domain-containing protein [Prauserella salsuginis]